MVYEGGAVVCADKKTYVVGVGAANSDLHCRSDKKLILRDSNPSHIYGSTGGVTRNILENMALLGTNVHMLSAIGSDAVGQSLISRTEDAGVDMSYVRRIDDTPTGSYVAILDTDGDMVVGMSDLRILKYIDCAYIKEHTALLQGASAIVCDSCMQPESLHTLLDVAGDVPVFLDPVSTAYAERAEPFVSRLYSVKPNRLELSALAKMPTDTDEEMTKAVDTLLARGTKQVVVSLGARGCYMACATGERGFYALSPSDEVLNATGAGDAFTAALAHAKVSGYETQRAIFFALAAGKLALSCEQTINPLMSVDRLEEIIRKEENHEFIS